MIINIFKKPIIKRIANKILKLQPEIYVFFASFLFYIALWILNPSNKMIVISFMVFYIIIYLKLKNFRVSLLLTFLVSSIIFTGKTYSIQLIPPGIFPEKLYPDGHILPFIFSVRHIVTAFLAFILIKDLAKAPKKFKLSLPDKLISLYFLWIIFTDLYASKQPKISLLYSLTSLETLVMYFYIRFIVRHYESLKKLIFWILISMALFQSIFSLQQFIYSAPTNNNLEYRVGIQYFGSAPDELSFRFRPMGTFAHANILAAWLTFYASIIFVFFYGKFNNFILGLYFVILTILILTLSRGAWLGYSASLFFTMYIAEKVKKKEVSKTFQKFLLRYLILGVFIGLLFVLPRLTASLNTFLEGEGGLFLRTAQLTEVVDIIKRNFILGVGSEMSIRAAIEINPNGIYSQAPLTVHNWYFLVMAEHGIPSLVIFLTILTIFLKKQLTDILKNRLVNHEDYLRIGYLGGTLSILIIGLFQPFLIMIPMFLFLSLYQNG